MCVVSMIMDHYGDSWGKRKPILPNTTPLPYIPKEFPSVPMPIITKEEIEEFRKLLERAREYDKKNNEPDCELESKKNQLKKLAEEYGIKIDFL